MGIVVRGVVYVGAVEVGEAAEVSGRVLLLLFRSAEQISVTSLRNEVRCRL